MKYRILFLFFEIQILRNILAILNDFNAWKKMLLTTVVD